MRIEHSLYELRPVNGTPLRQGALIRVGFNGIGLGHADIHPWPELGDLHLAEQLSRLARGELTPLTRRSLECARVDAHARAHGKSLFAGLEIPESHFLLMRPGDEAWDPRFRRIKVKMGKDIAAQAHWLNEKAGSKKSIRLDFNSKLSRTEFAEFLSALSADARDAIDYVEDPVEWSETDGFGEWDAPLAIDRRVDQAIHAKSPTVWIVKPAIQDSDAIAHAARDRGKRVVFTSYLDHPIGQFFAAYEAARIGCTEICGLSSHGAYEKHLFSESIVSLGPKLQPPGGTGLGWDKELKGLSWKSI